MNMPRVDTETAYPSSMSAAGLTIANFALVLVGLVVIARFGDNRLDTGLVNVWSIWGIAHVSIGQSLQVLAAMPASTGQPHSSGFSVSNLLGTRLSLVLGVVVVGAVAMIALRSRLFPGLDWNWPVAAIVGITSASVSGLLRGGLVRRRRAVLSLAVVCVENAARTVLLFVALATSVADALVPWAIVAPFLVSLPALLWFNTRAEGADVASPDAAAPSATAGRASLTMVPSLASYALLPLLSALNRLPETIAVDALAFDAALARGPVQVAVFAAPLALQHMLDKTSGERRVLLATPAMVGLLVAGSIVATLLLAPGSIAGRLVLIVLVGGVSLLGYAAILDAVDRSAGPTVVGGAIVVAVAAFVLFATIGNDVSLAPVAWASAATVGVLALAPSMSGASV